MTPRILVILACCLAADTPALNPPNQAVFMRFARGLRDHTARNQYAINGQQALRRAYNDFTHALDNDSDMRTVHELSYEIARAAMMLADDEQQSRHNK